MALAQPLPRKYLSQLQQIQADLRVLANRTRIALEQLESPQRGTGRAQTILREIETDAYRIALELAEMKVAEHCGVCPSAPPSTPAQIHLLVLADELERQATIARHRAKEFGISVEGEEEDPLILTLLHPLSQRDVRINEI